MRHRVPPTEMSTRYISWEVKVAGAYGWQPYHLHVPTVLKSGRLNLLEPSGPVQACNGIALPLPISTWIAEKLLVSHRLRSTALGSVEVSADHTFSYKCYQPWRYGSPLSIYTNTYGSYTPYGRTRSQCFLCVYFFTANSYMFIYSYVT